MVGSPRSHAFLTHELLKSRRARGDVSRGKKVHMRGAFSSSPATRLHALAREAVSPEPHGFCSGPAWRHPKSGTPAQASELRLRLRLAPRPARPAHQLREAAPSPASRFLARRLTREPERRECKTSRARNKPAPPAQSQSLAMTTPEVRRGAPRAAGAARPPAHAPPRSRGPASGRKRLRHLPSDGARGGAERRGRPLRPRSAPAPRPVTCPRADPGPALPRPSGAVLRRGRLSARTRAPVAVP